MKIKGRSVPESYDGTQAYILGDSNTQVHMGYWNLWSRKNHPRSRINFLAERNNTIPVILKQLKKIDPKKTEVVIIGSLGGNDAQGLKNKNFRQLLSPEGRYYLNKIIPLMQELQSLQKAGVKIYFFGLPFGRGREPERAQARAAVDLALLNAAEEYGIKYTTVFDKTEKIKGDQSGVHYTGDKRKAYQSHLAKLIGGEQPLTDNEVSYVRGNKSVYIRKNSFLRPYLAIKKAGFDFNSFYRDLEEFFPKEVGTGKKLLPVHGKDFIFGPEHFAALKKLSGVSNNTKYKDLVRIKNRKQTT